MPETLTHMLRRVLCPWNPDEIVDETLAWCRKNRVDEVMWITESSGMYRELPPLSEVRAIVERLHDTKGRCDAAGVVFSLNPLTTMGHGDYGNDVAARFPDMEMMVGMEGGVSKACACPMSPFWRDLMRETFALYATTTPARLWVEDDFRYANHMPNVRYGCYCPRHMEAFSHHVGERVARERLAAALLKPGEPHPWRGIWLDLLDEDLREIAAMIRQAAHEVSPSTELGLMLPNPAVMELTGTRIGPLMDAFAGERSAAIRMSTVGFSDRDPRVLLKEDESLKRVVPRLGARIRRCTEIETIPHSGYTVPASRIAAQIEWGAVLGVPHHTMNIFDYLGTPLAEVADYDAMLRDRKAEFTAFSEAFAGLTRYRGVSLPTDPESPRRVHTQQGRDMTELMPRDCGWADPLRAFGISVRLGPGEAVAAVTGQGLRCLGDAELEDVFSRGVLLDASAVQTLGEMGRGDLAGVEVRDVFAPRSRPIGPEELTDPAFGGGRHRYTWTLGADLAVFDIRETARPISRVLGADGEFLCHGVVTFENALGGRVACAPHFCQGEGPDNYKKGPRESFYSPHRRRQFHALLQWLGGGPPPLIVHTTNWVLPHRADGEGRIGLAAMNINLDPWEGVTMACAVDAPVRKIEWLDIDGTRRVLPKPEWRSDEGAATIRIPAHVPTHRAVAALLSTEV